jgi:hypothetical protein
MSLRASHAGETRLARIRTANSKYWRTPAGSSRLWATALTGLVAGVLASCGVATITVRGFR